MEARNRRHRLTEATALTLALAVLSVTASAADATPRRPLRPAAPPAVPCAPGEPVRVVAPRGGMMTAGYANGVLPRGQAPVYRALLEAFSRSARQRPAIANMPVFLDEFEQPADDLIEFPADRVQVVWEAGSVPVTGFFAPSLLPQEEPPPAGPFLLQRFLDGEFDVELRQWAREARDSRIPMFVQFGGEVTAGWPWSGHLNGGGRTDGYGDAGYPDGPERYRDAHRHVVELFREEGATNVTWVFGAGGEGPEEWNQPELYYPGDEFIDWLFAGVWGYYPPFVTDETRFPPGMDAIYRTLTRISSSKPIGVEMGYATTADAGAQRRKAAWIAEAYESLRRGRWPNVHWVSYWHESESYTDEHGVTVATAIDSSPVVRRAFRAGVAAPVFRTRPRFTCGPRP